MWRKSALILATPDRDAVLKSVSRSFYLSLRVLPRSVRPAIGLGYLLCRAADSIVDTPVVSSGDRWDMLNSLHTLMQTFPLQDDAIERLHTKIQDANASPASSEGRLLSQFKDFLAFLKTLPRTDQALVQGIVRAVIQGMLMDIEKFGTSAESLKCLHSVSDLNRYLGWIGGEPGRFWSGICLQHIPGLQIPDPQTWSEEGFQFGTGLQLVNILRDLPADLRLGRCYIPDDLLRKQNLTAPDLLDPDNTTRFLPLYHDLINNALERLQHGLPYIQKIPRSCVRLRAAAWWPLILGLKTLCILRDTFYVLNPEQRLKLTRWSVWNEIGQSLFLVSSNSFLKRKVRNLIQQIHSVNPLGEIAS